MGTEAGRVSPLLAYASFSISGGEFDPDVWTSYFEVAPDAQVRRGQRFMTRSGRLSAGTGRMNMWLISTRGVVTSDALDPHISFLVHRLQLPRTDLADRVRSLGASARFFCFWWNPEKSRTAMVGPKFRELAEASNIAIEIDEYPYEGGDPADEAPL
jgi:hypothetical protein